MTKGKNGKYRPILIHHTPEKTRLYEARVKRIARRFMGKRRPLDGAVRLRLVFIMPIPKSWPQWKKDLAIAGDLGHTAKPDSDNMEKAIKDAFNGVVWTDDCRVFSDDKIKLYERPGRRVGTYCKIELTDKYCSQITKRPATNSAQAAMDL
ncbi:RusA family crossover junction endodeoxyribonuclease [Porticoccaceae bacterium]|nr:RusA family crossover junction endodeoxyribonuclease [Porticoccaceae bacterium]